MAAITGVIGQVGVAAPVPRGSHALCVACWLRVIGSRRRTDHRAQGDSRTAHRARDPLARPTGQSKTGRSTPGQTVLMCALGTLSLGAACWLGCEYAHSVVFSRTGFAGRRYGQRAVRRVRFGTRRLCESRCSAGRLDLRAFVSRARERAGSHAQHAARPGHHQLGRARSAARARPELASSRECGRALARESTALWWQRGPFASKTP